MFLGIDNGASGGLAALLADGNVFRVDPMPLTDADLLQWCQGVAYCSRSTPFAVLEHAQAFPKMGRSGAFNYGRGYGAVQMALTAAGIPFDIVVPAKWQTVMGCRTGGDKTVSKRRAQQLFPGVKVTHAIADALLIAEFCRRTRNIQRPCDIGNSADARTREAVSGRAVDESASLKGGSDGKKEDWQEEVRAVAVEAAIFAGKGLCEASASTRAPRSRAGTKRAAR